MNTPARGRVPLPPGYYILALSVNEFTKNDAYVIQVVHNSWDYDGDNISDYVEGENDADAGTYDPQTWISYVTGGAIILHYTTYDATSIDKPLLIPLTDSEHPNRGTHDYTIAHGLPTGTRDFDDGYLENGLRIANFGPGYYDKNWRVTVPNPNYIHDEHNWGTLELINLVEKVGRTWSQKHADGPRIGVGDMSLQGGGETLDHAAHENGIDVDIRYVRATNGSNGTLEDNLSVQDEPSGYDQTLTTELIGYFLESSNVGLIILDPATNITDDTYAYSNGRIKVDWNTQENHPTTRVHANHFHVRIIDPDGTSN
ncbi:MAG: penicillin-insensitive murein endopeptidase [Ignavibacteria bacterium]|nr:penicillin-insensitive murein endopeptidase [Ignavibacteria bacterium]